MSICAAAVAAFAAWRVIRLRPRLRALRLGIDGERAVGQFLDRLREQGYQAFHDVLANGFNLDMCSSALAVSSPSKPRHGASRCAATRGYRSTGSSSSLRITNQTATHGAEGLPAFLAREPIRFSIEDIKLAAYHLGRYVRAVERERRPSRS
jgi:hypothetical protein